MSGILSIQFQSVIGDKDLNIQKAASFIKQNCDKKLDLIVLSEFFSTGISHDCFLNLPEDETGGDTIKKICELAKMYNANITAGTVIEKSKGKLYNTSFIVDRKGSIIEKYRKIHLFNYFGGAEGKIITAGNEIKTVELDFAKIGLAICYDIRYPRFIQNLARRDIDIIVLPTAWCKECKNPQLRKKEEENWIAMNKTRAYDNQVYFVSSNQIGGNDGEENCIGNSLIISPEGEIIKNAGNRQCAIYADIDIKKARNLKAAYPIAMAD